MTTLERLINLLRLRPRKCPGQQEDTTPFVSFRRERAGEAGAVIWVLDSRLNERSRYEIYWN